ncbi:Hydroxyacylglutathione hydrolase [subsurface metagenome]
MLAANCYILRNGKVALVIDPGGNAEVIYPYIEKRKLTYIINTHGHYDHIAANNELKAPYDTKFYTFPDDTKIYTGHGEDTFIGEEKNIMSL